MGVDVIEGVDYAFPPHPSIPGLAEAGKRFACRYVGAGTSDKHLTPAETQDLTAFGLSIVTNVEGAANGLLGGWDTGHDWALRADAHARSCGMPVDRPIYLSVDFDCTSSQWQWYVRDALRGAAAALGGAHRVGVYGSVRVMEWARRDGVAQWFWQTYAWSDRRWAAGNHIEQYLNGVFLAGADVDLNRALVTDYGQWGTTTVKDDTMRNITDGQGHYYMTNGIVRWPIGADGSDQDKYLVWGAPVTVQNVEHFGPIVSEQPPPSGGGIDAAAVRAIVRAEVRQAFTDGGTVG